MTKSRRRSTLALGSVALLVGSLLTRSARAETPTPAVAPAALETAPPPKTSRYTSDGLLGSVRVGPSFGIGAPDGLRFGAFAKWRGLLAAGGAFSILPDMAIPGMDARVKRASGEAFARVHPFRGALFLGVAGGYAQTKGTITEETVAYGQPQRVETHAFASTVYISPQVGLQFMLPRGVTIGCDLGVELPVATSGPTFDASKYGLNVPIDAKGSLADATRRFSTMPVPVIHVLEIGVAL